jgi:hypothetical protein
MLGRTVATSDHGRICVPVSCGRVNRSTAPPKTQLATKRPDGYPIFSATARTAIGNVLVRR